MDSSRNTDEFVRLFSLHTNSIYSYIHVLVPTHADAEDIFQETSRTLWEKFGEFQPREKGTGPICQNGPEGASRTLDRSSFPPGTSFRAWAMRIAQIEVLRYRQREGRRQKLFSDQLYAVLDEATRTAVDSFDLRLDWLGDCYQKLPEEDRGLIDARYRIGATVEAIAAELGRSIHSIYRALRRIHEALFTCVSEAERRAPSSGVRRAPGGFGPMGSSPFVPGEDRSP
jgi:RNA polymerase sigma-70 factor, ECF subfamily